MHDPFDPSIYRDPRAAHQAAGGGGGPSPKELVDILLLRRNVSRAEFWCLLAVVFVAWSFLMMEVMDMKDANGRYANHVFFAGSLVAAYLLFAVVSGRCRDIGRSNWFAVVVILFTPLGGIPLAALGMAPTASTKALEMVDTAIDVFD